MKISVSQYQGSSTEVVIRIVNSDGKVLVTKKLKTDSREVVQA